MSFRTPPVTYWRTATKETPLPPGFGKEKTGISIRNKPYPDQSRDRVFLWIYNRCSPSFLKDPISKYFLSIIL